MSHITKIRTVIKDLDCFATCCEELGLELKRNVKTFTYYAGKKEKCNHAVAVKNNKQAFEMGLVANGDGYDISWDSYGGGMGLVKHVGNNCEKLIRTYSRKVAYKQAKQFANANGWTISEQYNESTNESTIILREY